MQLQDKTFYQSLLLLLKKESMALIQMHKITLLKENFHLHYEKIRKTLKINTTIQKSQK